MSDDVPLAKRIAGPPTAWRLALPIWDAYFLVIAAVTLIAMLLAGSLPAAGCVAALAGWYAAFGRRLLRCGTNAQGLGYLAGVLVLLVPATVSDGRVTFILWALAPQAFMVVPLRWAVCFALLFNFVSPGVTLASARDFGQVRPEQLVGSMTAFLGTVVIGFTIQRLIEQGRQLYESQAEVARLSREAERQRLAADIHDTVAQGLSSLVMLIQAAEAALDRDRAETRRHLELAARTARDNLNEIRAVLDAIAPAEPDLAAALRRLVARFAEETGIAAELEVTGSPRALPTSVEVVLLRAAQESLSNIRRHADADSAILALRYTGAAVDLVIRDDGRGFDPGKNVAGYGLAGMRNRVEQIGGSLLVDSVPGETQVRVAAPA